MVCISSQMLTCHPGSKALGRLSQMLTIHPGWNGSCPFSNAHHPPGLKWFASLLKRSYYFHFRRDTFSEGLLCQGKEPVKHNSCYLPCYKWRKSTNLILTDLWLTVSYQELFVFSLSVLCFQILTVKLKFTSKTDFELCIFYNKLDFGSCLSENSFSSIQWF